MNTKVYVSNSAYYIFFCERKQVYDDYNQAMHKCRLNKNNFKNINNSTQMIINVRVLCKYPFGLRN